MKSEDAGTMLTCAGFSILAGYQRKPASLFKLLAECVTVVEPEAGIGPATYALRVRCSTTEIPGRAFDTSVYCDNPAQHHE